MSRSAVFWDVFHCRANIAAVAATPSAQSPKLAAMYVRMSTDHQKYSTENQADTIREYAAIPRLRR
jgi:hypothetical protein